MKLKNIALSVCTAALIACNSDKPTVADPTLKDIIGDKFLVGVALNSEQAAGRDTSAVRIVQRHFNSIVAENCMKSEGIHPEEDRYDFTLADEFVKFGEENGMTIIGHCLIWHSQLSPWFCVDNEGRDVSPEVLKQRMKNHIHTIVGRYKGRIKGWDVVNEAIEGDGSYRQSKFYEILGEEYIPLAFQFAHEADPDAELYYNDYGMHDPGRRDGVVRMVRSLKEKGLRVDAIGMQGHMGLDYPSIDDYETSILAFAATGAKIMITEWDMSALPTLNRGANIADKVAFEKALNPYPESLPDSISRLWNARMKSFMELFIKHSDVITRVTAWGVSDGDSWKNDWPVAGRRDYPLLFDRSYQPKPFLKEILEPRVAKFYEFSYSVDNSQLTIDNSMQRDGAANCQLSTVNCQLQNPVLPGCYPDPSICRVGNDYYVVNSSFAFFPGVPIWHSTDLTNWEQLGYVLNRPSQLPMYDGLRISGGIYAPDIKYNPHNGLFYMITTAVDGGGNFFVTTDDPKKCNWSDPIFLPEVGGIDPGFLFDEDGKAYIVNNDAPAGKPEYSGHRAIWIREFDWKNGCTVGKQKMIIDGGVDKSQHPVWIEGPHLYRINGTYYLMAAEGGTGPDHSEVIFTADTPFGPFKPCAINPILTQRGLPDGRPNPVTCVGHADLVQTPKGDWYAVFLGVRPYKGGHDVMGRETFLLPVTWKEDQPVILPEGETITYTANRPYGPAPLWTADGLTKEAFFIRTPLVPCYEIGSKGQLTLTASSSDLNDKRQPAAIGRWINNWTFTAQTALDFTPREQGDFAGITCFHDDYCYIRFGKTLDKEGKPALSLEAYSRGKLCNQASTPLPKADGKLYLKVEGNDAVNYTFSYATNPKGEWTQVGEPVSADLISTQTAGGFTGTMVGIYATGNYENTNN